MEREKDMGKTKIIAIEGIDGSGKGVQFRRLAANLRAAGATVACRDYPMYDTFFGSEVGRLLSGSDGVCADTVNGKSMALWFALDRWESFSDYRDGESDFLVINRYVLSNAVYQSIRDIDIDKPDIVDWVLELEYSHFKLPRPDVNLIFSVLPNAAEQNVLKKGFRDYVGGTGRDVYEASHGIQARAMAKYLEVASRMQDCEVIPCMKDGALMGIDDISHEVLSALKSRKLI